MFYAVFTFRRLSYIISQVFLNSHLYIQSAVNIFFTLVVIVYLFLYRPYKETGILISTILGEICTFEVLILSIFFIGSDDVYLVNSIQTIIVFSILATMILQTLVSLVLALLALRMIWRKIQKYRAKAFLSQFSASKIVPEADTIYKDTNAHSDNLSKTDISSSSIIASREIKNKKY